MNKKKGLRKGRARIEYIACLSRVQELRAKGYDIIMTYNQLKEEGLITMSYGGFYELLRQRKKKKTVPATTAPASIAMPPSQGAETIPPLQTGTSAVSQEQRRKEFQAATRRDIAEAEKQLTTSPELNKSEYDELSEKLI